MQRLLLVDDDAALCEMLRDYLEAEGFAVDAVHEGPAGLERAARGEHDLVLLDVMLPGMSGLEVLRELDGRVPVLMLTARGDDIDRILGLELGADDYVPKPCDPREITARIRAILRRAARSADEGGRLQLADLTVDPRDRSVRRSDQSVHLTGAEFDLLALLMRHAGEVVSRESIYREVLGREPGAYDRSLDMHVSNLRRKLGPDADGEARIQAVRGKGYILRQGADP